MAIRDREDSQNLEHIPIVALTAHAMLGDKEKCLQAGMNAYVSKPIRRVELVSTLNQILSQKSEPPSNDSGEQNNNATNLLSHPHDAPSKENFDKNPSAHTDTV